MTETYVDPLDIVRRAVAGRDGEPERMLPGEAYTSTEVLSWEQRHLFAGSWTCLGRLLDLFPAASGARSVTQRAVVVGDIAALLVQDGPSLRMFANTCRHRGHELLAVGDMSQRRGITCPYHAWTYDLAGALNGGQGLPRRRELRVRRRRSRGAAGAGVGGVGVRSRPARIGQ